MHLSENHVENSTGYWTVFLVYALAFASYSKYTGGVFMLGFILNYALRSKSEGTWIASHHEWQIRTVKLTLKGLLLCFILMFPSFFYKESTVLTVFFYLGLPGGIFVGGGYFSFVHAKVCYI